MTAALVMLAIFCVLLLLGSSVGVAGLAGAAAYFLLTGLPMSVATQHMFDSLNAFPFVAIPLFFLAGNLMNESGITDDIVWLVNRLVYRVRGALAYVAVIVNIFMAGVSGSALADVAAVGGVLLPAMEKQGYNREDSAALIACAAVVGPIIPPSIPMVLYGVTAGVSIGALFLAGALPGLLLSAVTLLVVRLKKKSWPLADAAAFKQRIPPGMGWVLGALGMPAIIVGGIWGGVFTPTEAAAVACLYAILFGALRRRMPPAGVWSALRSAGLASGNVLFLISVAGVMGWVLARARVPQVLLELVLEAHMPIPLLLLCTVVLLILLGMFLDMAPIILITTPILTPVMSSLGVNLVHFGVVMVVTVVIGSVTPPVGLGVYISARIAQLPVMPVFRASWPYIAVFTAVVLILLAVPDISLAIPRLLLGRAG